MRSDLQKRLVAETFARSVEIHAELPSTNDRALELARCADVVLPQLVLAERQTAGRGRGANRWWSAHGSLTFSLIVDADAFNLPVERRPQISLTAGLAVCEALDDLVEGEPVGLKWPNDVHLAGRKVCGILVETASPQAGRLVVGVGLNVNNSFADAPPELQSIATSLRDSTGRTFDADDVLIRLLVAMETELSRLAHHADEMTARWRSRCVLTGRTLEIQVVDVSTVGVCEGVDEDGALVLRTGAGRQRFHGGVVSRVE